MSNMRYWDAVKQPPASALKEIKGGRLSGMTDIKPQWRYQAMTEVYGPVGDGWKFEIVKLWSDPVAEGAIMAHALVNVYVKYGAEWSAPVPGIGGSMLVDMESKGLHNNDEGYKMAVTDALSVALKMFGVAADVYLGNYNGSKYADGKAEKNSDRINALKGDDPFEGVFDRRGAGPDPRQDGF